LLNKRLSVLFLISLFCFSLRAYAVTPPASQQASGQTGLSEQQEREQKLREKIEQPPAKIENQEVVPESQQPPVVGNEKTLINTITVTGNTIIPESEINAITHPFEGKELTVADMQKVADLVTDAFRKKGFITTRAIIPPQKVVNNTLELKIILGLMGELEVRGNHYFKKFLFTKRVTLKKGEPFNYNKLRSDLYNINQYPDRNVKTTLTPGQNPGETDVLFQVKDHLPIHVGFSYDTFGTRYLGRARYLGTATDNNLLGFDDTLTFQFQQSERDAYRLESFRYLLPVTNTTQLGFYSTRNQIQLQHEFRDVMARGKSDIYGGFVNQTLYNEPDLKIVSDVGFDYKDVFNFLEGIESSRDLERVAKTGFNVDYNDAFYGRNIVNDEVDFGIPDIFGGSRARDSHASILGSGGRFTKDVFDYLRLQSLPYDATLLFKSEIQFSGNVLDSTEQYQLGGISNVRAFDPGDAVGDDGQSATAELGLPVYGVPKDLQIPFSSAKLYDALRIATFFDWGHVSLREPEGGAQHGTLDGYGCGLRLTLPENFFFRIDAAWPISGEAANNRSEHTWLQVSKEF